MYSIDLGLRNAVSIAHSSDEGHLIEALVYESLRRRFGNNVYYWQGKGEIDFVIHQGTKITHIFQVVTDRLDDEAVQTREVKFYG